ncbi:MAG: class I SAM-dependent methyltransferase [Lysobacterales bacterium]
MDFPVLPHSIDSVKPFLDAQYLLETQITSSLQELAGAAQKLSGLCSVCERETVFSFEPNSDGFANWREQLNCQHCGLISRWRGSIELADRLIQQHPSPTRVYLTEQLTPVFQWASKHWPDTVGSEYVDETLKPGTQTPYRRHNVRHEDVTQLSFATHSLSHVLTFDVLEHVADYRAALEEFFRVLEPGGQLVISVPFVINFEATVVRAKRLANGKIEHLQEPEYHGDPVNADGVLCFYDFGWDFLDEIRRVGFAQVAVRPFWDPAKGYLGVGQTLITGQKP